ncbi:MAG: helix-turn-helix domain-containing protein [Peptococcaceae bacterium]|nr:helix-turn-helix domain-containing protein [Peptococcaceae bacterium]
MDGELLTISQTAKYLKLSEKTIRRLISDNRLTASKVGNRTWRIKTSDIEEYIQANSNGKKGANGE